ncbi:baculoviral IAP repeat-containing protein 7-B-like isoform X2 [Crassostrea angulata]|uniref:baculoviral IAP repeat-containing protein 7-B-like isoform X2 n=1 Tax=Magallana angulata TaxID=2784310 RepID=UPI0022B0E8A0|nr:baculoviral IAP repeat-containing protein 7-B-like isoform X2 [Crassostrea angulata]
MDQPNQETESELLVHLLTSLCLSNGNIRLNHENLNSAPVFGAYQNYEPELIGISSVHCRYSPGIPVSAFISPSRPPTSSGIFNIPNSGTMFRDGEALMNAVLNFEQSREVVNTPSFVREPHRNASPSYSQNAESRRSRSQNPDLETENSRLRQCNVCLEADACIHFRPCGHLCCCEACANRVTTCPLCRANIHEKLKTYFC